jgi:hypothetical protein
MKKATNDSAGKRESPEMLPEYDFTAKKGVRGKYYQAYRRGHTVKVRQEDGTVSVQYFTLEDLVGSHRRRLEPSPKSASDAPTRE